MNLKIKVLLILSVFNLTQLSAQEKTRLYYYVSVQDSVSKHCVFISKIESISFLGAPAFETYMLFGNEIYPQFIQYIQTNQVNFKNESFLNKNYYLSASRREVRSKISIDKQLARENKQQIIRIRKFAIKI